MGTRPERPEIIQRLRPTMPKIDRRFEVRPELTDLAQVSHGYTNAVALVLKYLRHRSMNSDLRLLRLNCCEPIQKSRIRRCFDAVIVRGVTVLTASEDASAENSEFRQRHDIDTVIRDG